MAEAAEDAVVGRLLAVPVIDGALVPALVRAVVALRPLPQLGGLLVRDLVLFVCVCVLLFWSLLFVSY